jgi:predicted Zn-ribbon and HTH transcriptional regulator
MNEHDVIRHMGRFPDKIGGLRMVSKKWKCSKCNRIYEFAEEVSVPSPCDECESIFFEKLSSI